MEKCLIKEGVGIENIVVGQSVMNDVVARFGSDYKLIEHKHYSYEASYERLGLSFYYQYDDKQKQIFQINIRPPFKGVTESGIVLGQSTLEEVERKYWPSNFSMTSVSTTWWLDYPGIQFHINVESSLKDDPSVLYEKDVSRKKKVAQIGIDIIDPLPPTVELQTTPVAVSNGPLLFFNNSISGQRRYSHYIVDPQVSLTPKLFLTADDENYEPLHRFNQDEFLMGRGGGSDLFFINTKTGVARRLLEGGLDRLFKVDGDKVFFIEQEHSDRGFAPNAEKIRAQKPQSRHTRYRLYVFDRTMAAPPTLVTREALLHLLAIDEKYCWVVLDRARPELWRISKDGQEEKRIAAIEDKWIYSLKDAAASPDGSLLALGVNDGDESCMRSLILIDVATGKRVFKSPEINVIESGERTFHPELKFIWLDNDRIRFSETETTPEGSFFRWVDLNIKTGKRLNEKRYSEIDYAHQMPSKDSLDDTAQSDAETHSLFVLEFPLLYFKGDTVPVADLRNESYNMDISISEDGQWAIFKGPKTGVWLADGVKKSTSRLANYGIDFKWMPALKEAR